MTIEASSNVDYETSDVSSQPTLTFVYANQSEIQQPYEPFVNSRPTLVLRPQQLKPYEEMNNDVWQEIFPFN